MDQYSCICQKCNKPLIKSQGAKVKLREKIIIHEIGKNFSTIQCGFCKSFSEVPVSLVFHESAPKEKFVIEEKQKIFIKK